MACALIASSNIIADMPSLIIRRLDEKTKARLRVRAAHHGCSMEEEAREILRVALSGTQPSRKSLADTIRARFAAVGGIEIKLPRRGRVRKQPVLGCSSRQRPCQRELRSMTFAELQHRH